MCLSIIYVSLQNTYEADTNIITQLFHCTYTLYHSPSLFNYTYYNLACDKWCLILYNYPYVICTAIPKSDYKQITLTKPIFAHSVSWHAYRLRWSFHTNALQTIPLQIDTACAFIHITWIHVWVLPARWAAHAARFVVTWHLLSIVANAFLIFISRRYWAHCRPFQSFVGISWGTELGLTTIGYSMCRHGNHVLLGRVLRMGTVVIITGAVNLWRRQHWMCPIWRHHYRSCKYTNTQNDRTETKPITLMCFRDPNKRRKNHQFLLISQSHTYMTTKMHYFLKEQYFIA